MIPMLILYLVKKLKKASFFSKRRVELKKLAIKLRILLVSLCIVTFSHANNDSGKNVIIYKVVHNNDIIGTIQIQRQAGKDSIIYSLESDITAKFILKFNIEGKERSVYKNDILVFSSVYRQVNKKVKANHQIVLENSEYHTKSSSQTTPIHHSEIKNNLVTLYFNEPTKVNQVFCDNEKRMVEIKEVSNGVYKVLIADGKYNVFHYKDGKCIKVEANSKLFNVVLIPA